MGFCLWCGLCGFCCGGWCRSEEGKGVLVVDEGLEGEIASETWVFSISLDLPATW